MHRHAVRALFGIGIALLAAAVGSDRSYASCGSASCFLVTHSDEGIGTTGAFVVDLSYRYVAQTKKLDGSHSTGEVLVPGIDFENEVIEPDHHREISTRTASLLLNLGYGVTSRLSVFGTLPLLVDKNHEHFDDVGTPDEHFTNGDGSRGFGDVTVGARYALLVKANDLLVGSASVKAPTGAYKLLDSGGAINEPTIQPGTGSYDGLISLYYVRHTFPSTLEWFFSGSVRINGRNPLEYQVGNEVVGTAGVGWTASERWVLSIQANARDAGRDDYRGEGVGSTGSRSLSLSPGVRFRSGDRLELYGYLQLPVYQYVNDAQLAPRAGFVLGLSKSF